ncbi:MAG: hypothetical protein J5666_00265 [Bacilli bacterium]|nr:hypothetical protein [Bacilli bacterium]
MKKALFNHNSSCQPTARTAEFFSCHTSNIEFLKGTMIIVSFLLCLIVVMLMIRS